MGKLTLLTFAALLTLGPSAGAEPAKLEVELLGVAALGPEVAGDPRPLGGVSGLAWSESTGWVAVSDAKDTPRRYRVRVECDPSARSLHAAVEPSEPLALGPRDAESIAIAQGRMVIGFEEPPAIIEVTPEGGRALRIPDSLTSRLRANRAWEAVALMGDPLTVWAGTEAAPKPEALATTEHGTRCAIIAIELESGRVIFEGAYLTDPAPPSVLPGAPSLMSLVEMTALPDGRLLALERAGPTQRGFDVRLFVVDPAQAARDGAVPKTLVADLSALVPGIVGNLEAMALGPELHDERGGRLLLVIADNNFAKPGLPMTQVIGLRLIESR